MIVDLSAVGDNAHGVILTGAATPLVFVVMWQGQALDLAVAQGATATVQPSDIQALAQAMADHLNAGLSG